MSLFSYVHKYSHPIANAFLKEVQQLGDDWTPNRRASPLADVKMSITVAEPEQDVDGDTTVPAVPKKSVSEVEKSEVASTSLRAEEGVSSNDTPDVPIRFSEKKRLDWAGKTCMFAYENMPSR